MYEVIENELGIYVLSDNKQFSNCYEYLEILGPKAKDGLYYSNSNLDDIINCKFDVSNYGNYPYSNI